MASGFLRFPPAPCAKAPNYSPYVSLEDSAAGEVNMDELDFTALDVRVGKTYQDHPVHEVRQRRGSVYKNPEAGRIIGRDKNAYFLELVSVSICDEKEFLLFVLTYKIHETAGSTMWQSAQPSPRARFPHPQLVRKW